MRISYKWLSEFVELPVPPEQLGDVLTFLGLELEASEVYKPSLENVLIGQVVECAKIEGTDHLSITKTNVGGETLSIVCGAPNVRPGLKVAVMLAGSKTSAGMVIKKAKLRGHESNGMLASEEELGLAPAHAGIIELPELWEIGAPASRYLNFEDTIYDVEITPNRPDLLSHSGVARDIAAKFKLPWQRKVYSITESSRNAADFIKVALMSPQACPRYMARVITGVKIAPSPFDVALRLLRCGIRPISNIVDATNYAMLESGQPLHAFDARFVTGSEIRIRFAADSEKFITLDGKEHKLTPSDILIADSKHGVALAGIMGGLNSEIRPDTTDVVLESAYFDPVHVRRTAKSLGISTDSSRRFERGCDPNQVPYVANAALSLMQEWGGGEVWSGAVDAYPNPIVPVNISFRPARASALIGLEYEQSDTQDILTRLGCEVDAHSNPWSVNAPTHRPDLEREVDLIEEVVRVHGYDNIPTAKTSKVVLTGEDDQAHIFRRQAEDILVGLGFHQALSLSMRNPEPRLDPPNLPSGVLLGNPVTDEMRYMQGSVLPSLFRAAASNFERGDRDLRLFETTRTFHEGAPDDPRTWERRVVSGLMTGKRRPATWEPAKDALDYFDLKAILDVLATRLSLDNHHFNCYALESSGLLEGALNFNGSKAGAFGIWPKQVCAPLDIDADVAWFELDLGVMMNNRKSALQFQPLPRFPLVWRDLAIVVDNNVSYADLANTIRNSAGSLLTSLWPFDVFVSDKLGSEKKSVAVRLEFLHLERSLEATEVDQIIQQVLARLQQDHSAVLR